MRGINAALRAKAFCQDKIHSGLMTPKIRSMTFTEDVNEYTKFTYWGFFRGVRQVLLDFRDESSIIYELSHYSFILLHGH